MEKEKTITFRFGQKVELSNAPLYRTATYPTSHRTVTGVFYLYDGKEDNGRLKVVSSQRSVRFKPEEMVFIGWVPKEAFAQESK